MKDMAGNFCAWFRAIANQTCQECTFTDKSLKNSFKNIILILRQKAAVHFERRLLILIKLLSPMVLFSVYILSGKFYVNTGKISGGSGGLVSYFFITFILLYYFQAIFTITYRSEEM